MREQVAAAIKSAIFAAIVPVTVAVLVPVVWLRPRATTLWPIAGWHWLGALVIGAGVALALWSMWQFAWRGLGTPAPIDPPKKFVASGPFRYVRNPMYIGVLTVIAGEAALFAPIWKWLLEYAAFVCLAFMLFVLLYEEPALRARFGAEYEEYCRRVPRWMPKWSREER